jgi:hypothetical protein
MKMLEPWKVSDAYFIFWKFYLSNFCNFLGRKCCVKNDATLVEFQSQSLLSGRLRPRQCQGGPRLQ